MTTHELASRGGDRFSVSRILAAIGSIVAIRLLVKAAGFGEKLSFTYFFGLRLFDAFTIAVSVPMMAYFCIRAVTGPTLLPVFSERWRRGDEAGAWGQIHAWLVTCLAILVPVSVAVFFWTDGLVRLLAPGFDAQRHAICVTLLRIMTPCFCLVGILPVAESVLNASRRFSVPPLSEFVMKALGISILVVLARQWGIAAAAWSVLFGMLAAVAVSLCGVRGLWRCRGARPDFSDPDFKKVLLLMAAPGLGDLFSRLGSVVENAACSMLQPGAVGAFDLARKIINVPVLIVPLASGAVLFTAFVELNREEDKERSPRLLMASIRAMLFVFVPLTAFLAALSEPVTAFVYQRGQFDEHSVRLVSRVLLWLSPSMCLLSIEGIIMSHFFSRQDLWAPVWTGIATVILRIALIVTLVPVLGLAGVAVAIVGSRLVKVLALGALLGRRGGVRWCHVEVLELAKLAVATLGATFLTRIVLDHVSTVGKAIAAPRVFPLLAVGSIGTLAYLGLSYALKGKECRYVIRAVMERATCRSA